MSNPQTTQHHRYTFYGFIILSTEQQQSDYCQALNGCSCYMKEILSINKNYCQYSTKQDYAITQRKIVMQNDSFH